MTMLALIIYYMKGVVYLAGINVPQYDIFKIETKQLKYHGWSLNITKDEAYAADSLVALFESEMFRQIAKILDRSIEEIEFSDYVVAIVISNKKHFTRAVSHDGVEINGNCFRRFVGTSGGLKKNTIIFVNAEILDELNRRCECGRKTDVPMVPAKYETYKALTCSASQPICDPKGILVVSDCLIKIKDVVKVIDDSGDEAEPTVSEPQEMELENNVCDGFNLCTPEYMERIAESLGIDYMPSGVCLRNAWLKGMLYPFPIMEFADEIAGGDYMVQDIWGDWRDIRDIELILNESSLKLWKCYDSIEAYVEAYHKYGYGFAVTKIAPEVLEDQRMTNYQYLQSYDLTDEDIVELCEPTVKWLRDSMGGDYKATLKFLGINDQVKHNTWQQALFLDKKLLRSPFIINSIRRMIRLKIDEAKIGKLLVHGNYQLASGDPYVFMEHVFGLKPTGLLKADECHSGYWVAKNVEEVVAFRSPMTVHNNIRKVKVVNSETTNKWYRYMPTVFIINGFDSFCAAENGCDYDGDLIFSTNNSVLLRKHRKLPALLCVQRNTEKKVPTEEDVLKTNIGAMGNKVGSITNRATSMMDKLSYFKRGSKEYEDIYRRIEICQLEQQNEIDKIKGIVAKPMPEYWYEAAACGDDDYLYSICTNKKPYFMIYIYDRNRYEYNGYIKLQEIECNRRYNLSLKEVLEQRIDDNFINRYYKYMPVSDGNCTMNRICHYIEKVFADYRFKQASLPPLDLSYLKYDIPVQSEIKKEIIWLANRYVLEQRENKSGIDKTKSEKIYIRNWLERKYIRLSRQICPNEKELLNIVLDIGFNSSFTWDCAGGLIIQRLEELS